MGLGSWVSSAVDAVGDAAEDAYDAGRSLLGDGAEELAHLTEEGLDDVGLQSAAEWVRAHGDRLADRLGAQVGERALGETDDPTQLVHGAPDTIQDRISWFAVLGNALGDVADGLRRIETGDWSGEGADAFAEAWRTVPADWDVARTACHDAASALAGYVGTVRWAQGQAAEAVRQWHGAHDRQQAALSAHRAAVSAYNRAVDAYNAELATGDSPGMPPPRPATFHDPGPALFQAAQELLADARRQRNDAAAHAAARIRRATATAPPLPSFHDRMRSDLVDGFQLYDFQRTHFDGGFVKGAVDLARTARALNLQDPYNLTHPWEFQAGLRATAAGMLDAPLHPRSSLRSLLGSGWSTDPAAAAGRLTPGLLLSLATGGGGSAAEAGLAGRLGFRGGLRLGRRASEVTEDAAKRAEHTRAPHLREHCKDPVDVATGAVVLDQTDVELPGVLPLLLTRRHLSSWAYGHWFGPTWASTLDERIDVTGDHVVVVTADARAVVFPQPPDEAPVVPEAGERGLLRRHDDGGYTLTDPLTGHVRHYPCPEDGRAFLAAITDVDGHAVAFLRDADGRPVEVRHSAGYRVLVDTSGDRVTGLAVVRGEEVVTLARFDYDDGRLVGVVDESGQPLRFGYDAAGRLTSWADRTGTVFGYAYDARGRCVAQSGTDGVMASRFAYRELDDGRRETAVTDARGTTRYVVDERLRVVAHVDALGHQTTRVWDGDRLVAVTDPLGRTTDYEHDHAGNVVAVTRPDGSRQTVRWATFADRDLPVRTTLPDGTVWTFDHDRLGRRTAVTDPLGATTRFGYDARGHLASVTDALGGVRRVETDAAGLPVAVTEADGATTRLERDPLGRVVAVVDALGARTSLRWTPGGRLAARTLPDGSTERWAYDGEGNPVEHVDAAGRVTRTSYTHFDLPAEVVAPNGGLTRLAYDPDLRLVGVTGPHGRTWRYEYDAAGRLVGETDFNGRTVRFVHDAAGQLVRRVNGAGEAVELDHDLLGRVVRQRVGGAVTRFAHDPLGRLLRATGPGVDLALERDPLGRVVAESVDGRTVTSSYDLLGRRTSRRTPGGVETSWSYGAGGHLERVVVDGREVAFARDPLGRETRREIGVVALDQEWDPLGQLVGQTLVAGPGPGASAVLQRRDYSYAPGGRLVGVADRLSGVRRLELDLADRIVAVGGDLGEVYAYDPMGNVVRAAAPSGDIERREYDGTLLTRAGRTRYTYDRQGRLVRRVRSRLSRTPEVWTYEWDADDRLVGLLTPDGARWRYRYDALGRRVAKRRLADDGRVVEEVRFTWDGPTLAEETAATGSRTWVHEGLAPIAQLERSADDTDARFFAIVTDLVGAPTELVTADGELVWHARRTVWGAPASPASDPVPLRFPGQYADPESGLFYNLQRYYDPYTARYLSQDPLGLAPAPNPNAYVSNPTVLSDPLGLFSCEQGELVPGGGSSTRTIHYRPKDAADPKWGLTKAHLQKHMFGDGPYSLKMIDPGGTPDVWRNYMQELASRPATALRPGGIEDIVGTFPKANGDGTFKLGLRVAERADGSYDLVTLLTRQ